MELNWLDKAYKRMSGKTKLDVLKEKTINKEEVVSPEYKQNLIAIILDLTSKYSEEQLQEHNSQILTSICEEETKSLQQ